jgi:predicted NACHT family NTPase
VKILLDRRFAPAHVQQELRDFLPSDEALFLLSKLAEMMHRSQLREIGRSKLEQEMIPSALALMSYTIASKRNADDLLTNISQRSQLLVERGLDQNGEPLVGFSHLSFQEYLAALQFHRRMSTEREANVTKDLLQLYRSNREWWEEVCALYAAQLQGPQRKAFMQRFYPEAGT